MVLTAGYKSLSWADSANLAGPRSMTSEKVGVAGKNMGGPIKFLHVIVFKIIKKMSKMDFGPIKCRAVTSNRFRLDFSW